MIIKIKKTLYYLLYYFPSILCFYLSGTNRRNKKKLQELNNKFAGKRCFIICNGPSLRAEDLTMIYNSGDISIGMNMIGRIFDKTPWRPTILSARDDCVFHPLNRELVENTECGFKIYDRKRFLRTLSSKGNIVYMKFNCSRKLLDNPAFDINATKALPSIGTSAYSMIEVAGFLGCRDIYILGCDMSYAINLNRDGSITFDNSGKNHFYGKEKDHMTSIVNPNPTWELQIAFEEAERLSKEYGIKIYNATRGGKLEAFERVDFDSLFNI